MSYLMIGTSIGGCDLYNKTIHWCGRSIRYTDPDSLHADSIRYTEKAIGYTETFISYTETAIRYTVE